MTGVRAALFWSLTERYLLIVLALASNVILARLLTPEEVGIYSVSLAVIGIAQVMRDFGIGNFLIQERELSEAHVRTAFGLSLLIGGSLFLLTFGAAGLIAAAYSEPRMATPLRICALNFMVLPFCSISLALLRRDMQFRRLLLVTLASALVGFAVTVGLAWAGAGPDSMAIGSVALNITTGIGAWLARVDRKMLAPSLSEWRRLLKFGAHSSAASVATSISMDINDLVLAKVLGFAPVAVFSRAQGLSQMFTRDLLSAIRNVALPAYSQAARDGQALEPKCIASVASVTAVGWPFFGFLALYPSEIVHLLYGPQWTLAIPLVPILAAAGAAYTSASLAYTALTAVGRVDLVANAELLFQPMRAALIVAAAMVFQTLMACALAYLISMLIFVPLAFHVKGRSIANDMGSLWRNLLRSLGVAALTLLAPMAIVLWHGLSRTAPMPTIWFVAAAISGTLCWMLALHVTHHPIGIDRIIGKLVRPSAWRN